MMMGKIARCVVMEMVMGMETQAAVRSVINIMMEGVLRKTGTGFHSQEDAWSTLGSRDGEGHGGQQGVHDGGVQDDVKALSQGWPGGAGRVPQIQGAGVHGGEGGMENVMMKQLILEQLILQIRGVMENVVMENGMVENVEMENVKLENLVMENLLVEQLLL